MDGSCKVRNSKRQKNRLFLWRQRAGKTQDELGLDLTLNRTQVAEYETNRRPLRGEGLLIIQWARACSLPAASRDVQDFLYETGNAPLMPDPNCPHCQDAIAACATNLFSEHQLHPLSRFPHAPCVITTVRVASRVVVRCLHPYTGHDTGSDRGSVLS